MTTFKDLLSKEFQNQLKELGNNKPDTAPNKQSNNSPLPNDKQVMTHVKRLGKQYVDEDKVLFMQAMCGVTPLKHEKAVSHKPIKSDDNAPFRRANAQGNDNSDSHALSDMKALLNPVAGEAFLSYKNPTLQNKIFEQLRQGKLRWYDAVDLHGSSIDDAREGVTTLINNAIAHNETVIKIVHGKGADAIIKTCVNGWLRQIPSVLAFVSAPSHDGGNGAVLVLLKRQKLS